MTEIEELKQRIDELEKKFENLWEQCQNDFLPNGEPNDDRIERCERKLVPCPACGERANIWTDDPNGWGETWFYAVCEDDEDCGYKRGYFKTLDEVVEDWNKKAKRKKEK